MSALRNPLQDDMQQAPELLSKPISVTKQAPTNTESEKTEDFPEDSYKPWRILAFLDAMATESLIDNCFVKNHEFFVLENAPER